MKLLIATESYYPNISGVAVFSHNIAQKMAKIGCKVYVLAPSPSFKEYTETVDCVKIFRIASKKNKYRQGYYVSKFPFHRVAQIINKINPDIVHLQDPALISLATLRIAHKNKIPIVVTNHFSLEYVVSYLPRLYFIKPAFLRIAEWYLKWFYNKCDVLTCPTKTVANRFCDPKYKTQVKVVSNGVDLSRFMPYWGERNLARQKWSITKDLPIVLYLGRLDIDKDIDVLIRAIPKVLKKIKAHFLIIGDGTEKENLSNLVKELGVKDNVTFGGYIQYKDEILPKIYQSCDLFVNPSTHETQSIVTLEAMASGLPIIAANAGALPEIVKNDVNGYLFKPGDTSQLSKLMIKILQNPKLKKQLADKSLEFVNQHLSQNTEQKFHKIYQELVKNEG